MDFNFFSFSLYNKLKELITVILILQSQIQKLKEFIFDQSEMEGVGVGISHHIVLSKRSIFYSESTDTYTCIHGSFIYTCIYNK